MVTIWLSLSLITYSLRCLHELILSREKESDWPKLESDVLTGPINSGRDGVRVLFSQT